MCTEALAVRAAPLSLRRLERRHEAADAADACRSAALHFLREGRSWGRPELVAWLEGPCDDLTSNIAVGLGAPRPRLTPLGQDSAQVRLTIVRAHDEALVRFRRLADASYTHQLNRTMLLHGYVSPFEDPFGAIGYVPTYQPRRLVDLLTALVSADLLARPTGALPLDVDATGFESTLRHREAVWDYVVGGA